MIRVSVADLYTHGHTHRMTVKVVMSRATRVPGLSLSRLTDDLHPTTYRGPDDALTMTEACGISCMHLLAVVSPTSLFIQLPCHFADDLANRLQGFDIVF